jgi:signal transduction histidine kinase
VEPTIDERAPDVRRGAVRGLSLVVLVVLLLAAGGAAWGTRRVVHDQEHRLLTERTSEVNLILQTATSAVQAQMANAGTAARLTNGSQQAFVDATKIDVATTPNLLTEALLAPSSENSDAFVVVAAVGSAYKAGDTLTGERATVLKKAIASQGQMASTRVLADKGTKTIGLAAGPPVAPPGQVLYRETGVAPAGQSRTAAAQPFSELNVVLYASPTAEPSQALLSSTKIKIPLQGDVVNQPFKLGVTPWLLSVTAQHPLVGSLASRTPWFVLVGVILLALLMAYVLEVVLRRRDYALALVDDRTAALRTSLGALESAQEQLVRQERLAAVGQLASAVGHELRNPLGVISNSLYLIRGATTESPDDKLKRHVATAEREVAAATLIISDLLDFARAREPIVANVDVNALVDEALEVAPPPDGITVSRDSGAPLSGVAADRDQLRQVLLNLITNGYDAMAEGGELHISTAASNGRVSIVVHDHGAGMSDDTRSHLFEPFFTTKARGVGLGLAVTQRIVGAHGGTISVDSKPGEGATFTVSLPVFTEATAAQ